MKAKLQDTHSKYEEESEDEIGIQIMFERTEHEPKVIKELHLEISLSKKTSSHHYHQNDDSIGHLFKLSPYHFSMRFVFVLKNELSYTKSEVVVRVYKIARILSRFLKKHEIPGNSNYPSFLIRNPTKVPNLKMQ